MCDNYWEPLTKICISDKETAEKPESAYVYRLCSGLYIRCPEVYTVLPSKNVNEGEDINIDHVEEIRHLHKRSDIETQSIKKHNDEPVSRYYSASYVDDDYSTDEHDFILDSANLSTLTQELRQSDFGTDSFEYYDQHEARSLQNLVASHGKTCQSAEIKIESDDKDTNVLIECNQALGDKKSVAQSLSDSVTLSNREAYSKDLISRFNCDPYNYSSSMYYENNKSAMDIAWEKFWAKNGEQLIWASWIEKYADYINPDYFQNTAPAAKDEKSQDAEINEVATEKYFEQNTRFSSESYENCELVHSNFAGCFDKSNLGDGEAIKPASVSLNTNFSFEDTSKQEIDDKEANENRKKIVNLEISPEDGNGWNPLSPFSTEENYEQHSNAEDERLLTRCDSNGSIARTNATFDSMTNVTKITLTSSSCSSVSSNPVVSVTSSIESSITSSSSDQENEFPLEDNDKYWQYLWGENFQIQYQKYYELFVENYKKDHNMDCDQSCLNINESGEDSKIEIRQDTTALLHDNATNEELLESADSSSPIPSETDDPKTRQNPSILDLAQSENKNTKNNTCYLKSNKTRTQELRKQRLCQESVGTLLKIIMEGDMNQCIEVLTTSAVPSCTDYKKSSKEKSNSSSSDVEDKIIDQKHDVGQQARNRKHRKQFKHPIKSKIQMLQRDTDETDPDESDTNTFLSFSDSECYSDSTIKKKNYPKEILENKCLKKYFHKRYQLFSKYDESIILDAESWFSVTPEKIASNIAEICSCDIVIDAFCGAGGNTIQFAFICKCVIAIDIDPNKIKLAQHNAKIYGVDQKIQFIVGDFMQLAPKLRADVVFLSPPWGGPAYKQIKSYDLDNILFPLGGIQLFRLAQTITPNIAYYLPKNVNTSQVINLVEEMDSVKLVYYKLNNKSIACTAFFDDLILSQFKSLKSNNFNQEDDEIDINENDNIVYINMECR